MAAAPWLDHYDAGIPETLAPYPDRTLLDDLAEAVAQRPDAPAVLFKGRTISHGELDRASDAFAAALVDLGVAKGDRVAVLLPNCPQFLICELGAWKAGAILVPLNPIYTTQELEGALARTGAGTIVVLTPFYERVKAAQPGTAVGTVIATNVKEYLPPVLRVLFTLAKERKDGHRVTLQEGDLWLGDLLARSAGRPRPAVAVGPDDPAVILMSGGTTGTPKGVVGLHRHYTTTGRQIGTWLQAGTRPWDDVLMAALPLFHSFANIGIQSVALRNHNAMALVPNPRDLDDLLHTISKTRPAAFSGVPTLFNALLHHPKVKAGKVDFRSVRVCFSGAAPLLAETKRRFEELTGGRIVEGYSLTEAMLACAVNPVEGPNKIGSVGMPLPDVEMRIVDTETGAPLPTGEVGEILIRAPQLMDRYWDDPEETASTVREHDGQRWLHTGDLGYLDADGYLFIVDRMKDLIKTHGYQVWPREIEEVLAAHPAVAEVGVAGVPDQAKGEVAKAWVVLAAGRQATEEELRAFARERLAPYKVPAAVEFRDELPKTMVGKVLRRALTDEPAAAPSPAPSARTDRTA
ncbi:MAG TPA: long-chain fatty acid--CoA ligase [Actinomycetes bacterium]|nr:long-chain fatty acid--CoA ligase [Actinomycetes bacterium]